MSDKKAISSATLQRARQANALGMQQYERWDIEEAIKSFEEAIRLSPEDADFHLNLARAQARYGDFDTSKRALGSYIRFETDEELAERFEHLFGEGMDEVESLVTTRMTDEGLPLEITGAAVQMWLEYRICIGRRPLIIRKPETWASALDYTVRKVNFQELTQRQIADLYGVSPSTVRAYHNDLVQVLDIMPCDYRYFRDEDNPLDRLVEAAAMLEELEERFRQP
jgi:tetratricopeptide (TPR) repeat protein